MIHSVLRYFLPTQADEPMNNPRTLEELVKDANLMIDIKPRPFKLTATDRKALIEASPSFMNECKGGACMGTREDFKQPDSFEVAAATAWMAISDIFFAPHHHSQKIAVYDALEKRIQ